MENPRYNRSGQSILEVILASAIFIIIAVQLIGILLQSFQTAGIGNDETAATQYAAEGLDAVRDIRNQSFALLATTTGKGVATSTAGWIFSGTSTTFGKFTRAIIVSSTFRNASGSIVASGGTLDPNTERIISTVSWLRASNNESVTLSSYLTNWRAALPTTTIIFLTTTGSSTWTVPGNWDSLSNTSNTIALIGGGGGGAVGSTTNHGGGGGGGGAFAMVNNYPLVASGSVHIYVGAGGASGTNGTDTYIGSTTCALSFACAKGGGSTTTFTGFGFGGLSAGIGTTTFSGGNGGPGNAASSTHGGGGGGAGGPFAVGAAGLGNATSTGGQGDGTHGGAGGLINTTGTAGAEWTLTASTTVAGAGGGGGGGNATSTTGKPGGLYGAGGGGSEGTSTAGTGAQGIIVIIYQH